MMQMFKYPHGEGECRCRCRIDYDGPVTGHCPTLLPRDLFSTPKLSRFAITTLLSQTCTRMGGRHHGD